MSADLLGTEAIVFFFSVRPSLTRHAKCSLTPSSLQLWVGYA